MLRRLFASGVLCLLGFVLSTSGEVVLVGKDAEVVVSGASGSATVYYTADEADGIDTVSITPIGHLSQGDGLALKTGPGKDKVTRYVQVTVTPGGRLKPGQAYTGSIVLSKGATYVGQIGVSVTVASSSITVDAVHADLCVTCAGPHAVPVRIRNSGTTVIDKIHVGPLALYARGLEWIVPAPNGKDEEEEDGDAATNTEATSSVSTATNTTSSTVTTSDSTSAVTNTTSNTVTTSDTTSATATVTDTATTASDTSSTGATTTATTTSGTPVTQTTTGTPAEPPQQPAAIRASTAKLTVRPGSDAPLVLQPGESRVIYVAYDPPRWAGDYAGSIEISVPGSDAVKTAVTLRSRGPYIDCCLPFWLFLAILFLAVWLAWLLEDYFGSGKGDVRDEALTSLDLTRVRLTQYRGWLQEFDADKKLLPETWRRVELNLREVNNAIGDQKLIPPDALKQAASDLAAAYEKRRALADILSSVSDPKAVALKLDGVPVSGSLDDYKKSLEEALKSEAPPRVSAIDAVPENEVRDWPRIRRRWMHYLRRISVIAVSVITAFLALYYGKCAFGTMADYAQTFFWGLGLTAAGNALIREGNTQYKKEGEAG
ncbi:MAG TPA: hypothetical protein VGQ36_22040 [Thermoanaerobaculia bacterium]|jgi:hypothetical protein|nr:hypothetical protein [Thermoanaerobaculia bacterium]